MYTDPKRDAFAAMGARHGIPSFECGPCVTGTLRALWQGCTRCWCMCSSGDVEQQGAAFVITPPPQQQCTFRHIEQRPGDHADTNKLFRAAGLQPPAQHMK
jgi:hypothetical protein